MIFRISLNTSEVCHVGLRGARGTQYPAVLPTVRSRSRPTYRTKLRSVRSWKHMQNNRYKHSKKSQPPKQKSNNEKQKIIKRKLFSINFNVFLKSSLRPQCRWSSIGAHLAFTSTYRNPYDRLAPRIIPWPEECFLTQGANGNARRHLQPRRCCFEAMSIAAGRKGMTQQQQQHSNSNVHTKNKKICRGLVPHGVQNGLQPTSLLVTK